MGQSLRAKLGRYCLGKLRSSLALACLIFVILGSRTAFAQMPTTIKIGEVEFYGYGGLDLSKIKAVLPIHVGDSIPADNMSDTLHRANAAIKSITGHGATDLAPVCCDPQGNWILYVGLPGTSSHPFHYNLVPTGKAKLPENISALYQHLMDAIAKAVQTGHASEDDSQGYALTADPAARSLEIALRQYALSHTSDIRHVLASSASAEQRQVSATALGYAQQSPAQVQALVQASRDPDDEVRNNATRALMVLAGAHPQAARLIPPAPFIAMLNSGTWTDRNKGGFLLSALSTSRSPILISQIRKSALPSLIEMAHWDANHAGAALMILGRIGGIPEAALVKMAKADQVDDIINAVQGTPPASAASTPAPPVHLTIIGTQTTLADALSTLAHQTGATILTESTIPVTPLATGDLTQPSLDAMLTQMTSAIPDVLWEKVTWPQGQTLPTGDVLANTMRILESVSATQITAQNSGSQTSLLFSKTTAVPGTTTVTTTGTQTVYLVRSASAAPASPSTPGTQAVSNLKTIADLFGQMTPDQQKQAIPLMMPQIMRLIQNMDPSVRAQLYTQLSLGIGN